MKRICVLIPVVCLLLCACGRGETRLRERVPEWPFAMTAPLAIEVRDGSYTADWTYKNSQSAFTLKTPHLPQRSAFVLLDRAYRALTDGMVEPRRTQEGWLYDGLDRYGFEAICSADGSLQIRFPKADAEASFTVEPIEEPVG